MMSGYFCTSEATRPILQELPFALRRVSQGSDEIPAASICSGWGVAEMVVDSLNNVLARFSDGQTLIPKAWLF